MAKMTESELVAAIEQQESTSATRSLVQEERDEALDRYFGRPMGNEVEGRSQVVSRQVWDTVEWLMPQLADIFTSGEEIVSFSPRGKEDVKQAEQETDYVNHLITQRNNWFEIWYNWTHDALIQKNGYVKVYWDDAEDKTMERYQGLTQEEYTRLAQDDGIAFIEAKQEPAIGPDGMPVILWSCEVERTKPRNVVKVENVPPENVRVSQNARGLSLQDPRLPFVQHIEKKSISDLRNEGFDVPDDINDTDTATEIDLSTRFEDVPFRDTDGEESDPSMRMVTVRHTWIRCDFDGDGRAELRDVIVVGSTILQNEDTDCVNLVALCPTPLPHTHTGLSVADAIIDLEKIMTALLRGALDNQYLANNGRYGVSESVNLDDMLDSRAGGIVRVNGKGNPGEHIFPLTHPTTGNVAVPMMEYIDKIRERRTGISEQTQGLNPQALNNQAGAAANAALLSASQQRIKFIARIFAETGIKSLFQLVHQLTLQNSRQQEIVELRGEWVPVNPRQWFKRNDMVISVALGAGDRVQQLAYLSQQRMMQMEAIQFKLVSPSNIYNTLARMTKAAGYKDPSEFWTDPAQVKQPEAGPDGQPVPPKPGSEWPPAPPPEAVQIEQMRQQGDAQKLQATQHGDIQKFHAEQATKQRESQMNLELQASNDMRDQQRQAEADARSHEIEVMKEQNKRAIEEMKIASEERKAQLSAEVELRKAEMVRLTALETAELSRKTALDTANIGAETSIAQSKMTSDTTHATAKLSADTTMKSAAESKKPAAPDKSLMDAVGRLEKHMTAPRKKVRDASGKLVGVEINGTVVPIEG